ncbi:hypothetical protein [Enterobacter cloacae complex sp. I2]|uniref:hypothetical protein n=1 Tax=Enterobacter cloacae complex sp. I2 TaxID=2779603 RepID=UPI001865F54A|nr:hypothetical protein [Enterobacter cloacae complex sp. I2]MBE3514426.1 hypothetical protein [Enterobacter cloacae complex sp. I2]
MEKEHFKAHVQYGDWKGSVAADDAYDDFAKYLSVAGILKQGEMVTGISFHSTENFFDIEAYITEDANVLRKERVQMTLEEFFKTFKRFSIKISRHGELDDQEIEFKV